MMVYREQLGIDLPDYAEIFVDDSLASLRRVARTMKEERLKWQQVQTPIPYDVILLRVGGLVCHAGLVIDRRRMLHIMDGVNSTVEEFASPQWKQRVEGFYRWIIDKS